MKDSRVDRTRLRDLYDAGMTDAEIVAATGWARSSVQYTRADVLKLPVSQVAAAKLKALRGAVVTRNRTKLRDEDAFRTAHAEGLADSQLGARFGLTRAGAFRARERLGLPANDVSGGIEKAIAEAAAQRRRDTARAAGEAAALVPVAPAESFARRDVNLLAALACGPVNKVRAAEVTALKPAVALRSLARLRRAGVVGRVRSGRRYTWALAPSVVATYSDSSLTPLQQLAATSPVADAAIGAVSTPYLRKLPHLEHDIRSAAALGAVDAALRFDPTRGQFSTFVARRVAGSILDTLRASALKGYRRSYGDDYAGPREYAGYEPGGACDPLKEASDASLPVGWGAECHDELERLTRVLPERQRTVLRLHFGHGLNFREIADRLGVVPSRVSVLARDAIAGLRAHFKESAA